MSALEEVRAAINKLVELKAASTPPTGGTSWYQGKDGYRGFESAREIFSGRDETLPGSSDIATWVTPEDATLIVTLHATIDAQAAVMRNFTEVYGESETPNGYAMSILTLARAINGAPA